MVKVVSGDLFKSRAQTLVNPVNCVGVMGKGVALEFKKRFPGMFTDYKIRCQLFLLNPGEPYLYSDTDGTSIVLFPTKGFWQDPSRLNYVTRGLEIFTQNYRQWGIESAAFPALGCGNGGLDWAVVSPIMQEILGELDIPVEIYAPQTKR